MGSVITVWSTVLFIFIALFAAWVSALASSGHESQNVMFCQGKMVMCIARFFGNQKAHTQHRDTQHVSLRCS